MDKIIKEDVEFKMAKVKGNLYLQIWEGEKCYHLGSARKVLELVRPLLDKKGEVKKLTIMDVLATNSDKEMTWDDDEEE